MTRTPRRDTPPSHCTSLSGRPGTSPPSPRHTADPATRYRCYFLHSVLKQSCTFVPLMTRSGYYRSVCSPGVWCRLCCSLCRWIETIGIIDAKRVSFNLSDDWLGVDVLLPDVDLHDLQHLVVPQCLPGGWGWILHLWLEEDYGHGCWSRSLSLRLGWRSVQTISDMTSSSDRSDMLVQTCSS